jgi:predicted site-specific integrase-resolvase
VKATITTNDAAAKVGITRVTLQRWLKLGKIQNPPQTVLGAEGRAVRLWSKADIAKLRKLTKEIYREGMGRRTDLIAAQKKSGNR